MDHNEVMLLLLGVLLLSIRCTDGYASGAPTSYCRSMRPPHGSQPSERNPYKLDLGGVTSYKPGVPITVTVRGESFKGIFLQARKADGSSTNAVGTWNSPPTNTKRINCPGGTRNAISQSSSRTKAEGTSFVWIPPNANVGPIVFQALMMRTWTVWWLNTRTAALTFETITTSTTTTTTTTTTTPKPTTVTTKPTSTTKPTTTTTKTPKPTITTTTTTTHKPTTKPTTTTKQNTTTITTTKPLRTTTSSTTTSSSHMPPTQGPADPGNPCDHNPCQNGGTCYKARSERKDGRGYFCHCAGKSINAPRPRFYHGPQCQFADACVENPCPVLSERVYCFPTTLNDKGRWCLDSKWSLIEEEDGEDADDDESVDTQDIDESDEHEEGEDSQDSISEKSSESSESSEESRR